MGVLINVRLLALVAFSRDMLASCRHEFCFFAFSVTLDVALKPIEKAFTPYENRVFVQDTNAPPRTPC